MQEAGTIFNPILQMRKLRNTKIKWLASEVVKLELNQNGLKI